MSNKPAARKRRGLMLVLSSPSGAGKSTLSKLLLESDDDISMSVSVTTRPPRPSEIDGVHYLFRDEAEFERMVAAGELLEHATVFDHRYGTPKAAVDKALFEGRDILFDIDWQGTQQLKEKRATDLVTIFILPPDIDELERRLRRRAQDSEETINRRMAGALGELSHYHEYDYRLLNERVDDCLREIKTILRAERLKGHRQPWVDDFVSGFSAR